MIIQSAIEQKLALAFQPIHLEVINESSNHSVPAGSESHFKVVLVSTAFEGHSMVQRHRLVNKVLSEELQNGVHALAMKLMTPQVWEESGHVHGHTSPACAHQKA